MQTFLVANGVPYTQIGAKGFGPDVPIAPNKTAAGRANRAPWRARWISRDDRDDPGVPVPESASERADDIMLERCRPAPFLRRVFESGGFENEFTHDQNFQSGLDRVLDGIGVLIARRA